jgi:hypothetical protein
MSSLTRCGARSSLVAVLIASLVNLPAMAAGEKPLGMVVASEHAHLDSADAVGGTTVYSGDSFVTDSEGSLRLKLGGSQVYVLASSSAKVFLKENKLRASVDRGTLGFATAAPNEIEIETPLAAVRGANGEGVYGQVALAGADKMTVTAYRGSLLVAADDQEQIVKPGQSYAVSFAPDAVAGGQTPEGAVKPAKKRKKRLAFILLASGAVATTGVLTWRNLASSPSSIVGP